MAYPYAYRFSMEFPKGKLFHVDELPDLGDEWVDTPAKLRPDDTQRLADLLQDFRDGNSTWRKDRFVELAELMGADFSDGEPTVKEIRAGIVASIEAIEGHEAMTDLALAQAFRG